MTLYQQGDLHAFGEIVSRHEKRLWNFVRRFVAESATAEDLVQEVFLRLVKSSSDWVPTAKLSTWLFTIARNLCTDQARQTVFRKTDSLNESEQGTSSALHLDAWVASGRGADQALESRQNAARIERALALLPVEQREVFLLREVSELSFSEIAMTVKASEPTVKSRMRYALERLRETIEQWREQSPGAQLLARGEETP